LNDAWKLFEAPFRDHAQLAVDRALAELRAGRPILLEGPVEGQTGSAQTGSAQTGSAMIAAVDALSPSLLDGVAGLPDAELALSTTRAQAIGLPAEGPVAVAVAGLDRHALHRLASAADAEPPRDWRPADDFAAAGIELCKQALLLPAVLQAGGDRAQGLPAIHRARLDEVRRLRGRQRDCLEIVAQARVPLAGAAEARFVVFRGPGLRDQVAIVVGNPDPGSAVALRLHSACLTGDLFGSLRCDCGDQLRQAVGRLAAEGGGILLYLDQEGRGTGLRNKIRAYALQDEGFDTIDADALLGYGADERRYDLAADMLLCLGYRRVHLLTNNPDKVAALHRAGITVEGRHPLTGPVTPENRRYLATKAVRAGHLLDELLNLSQQADARQVDGG
jgi:GTP cyclohydrolase II